MRIVCVPKQRPNIQRASHKKVVRLQRAQRDVLHASSSREYAVRGKQYGSVSSACALNEKTKEMKRIHVEH